MGAILQKDVRALEARVRAAEQAMAGRRAQSLNRMPSPASMPELQGRRHSAPEAAADSLRRRSSHQQPSLQQPSRPDDTATEGTADRATSITGQSQAGSITSVARGKDIYDLYACFLHLHCNSCSMRPRYVAQT